MVLRVAVAQIRIGWDLEANVAAIRRAVDETAPGTLLVLPEAAVTGYDDTLSGLDALDPEAVRCGLATITDAVRRAGIRLLCGALLPENGRWWNAALYFGPDGNTWSYRKINLAMHERGRLAAGSHLPLLDLDDTIVGVQLCREIRFPEQWCSLAERGAAVLAYLTYAANPREPAGVWRAHLISRAAETQRFVVAANVADDRQHCPSLIVSPRGEVIAESRGTGPQRLTAELDLSTVRTDYLDQRRTFTV